MSLARRLGAHPVIRFLIVGGINTALTGALVVVLSYVMYGWLAFTIAFALGIAFSVVASGRWVFQSHLSARRVLTYVVAYLVIYGCGVLVVQLLHAWGAPPWANIASVIVTAPLSFLAGRLVFRGARTPDP